MAKKQHSPSVGSEFLTAAVQPKLGVKGVFLWLGWGLLAESTIAASISLAQDQNMGAAVMALCMLVGLLYALYRKIVRVRASRLAVRLASALSRTRSREIPCDEFNRVADQPDATASLIRLIEHEYLQNVTYDQTNQVIVILTRPDESPIIQHLGFNCDSCGSSGVLSRMDKPVCPYCGSAVTLLKVR